MVNKCEEIKDNRETAASRRRLRERRRGDDEPTFSHVDRKGTPADLTSSKGHRDDVLPLLGRFVGAAVAIVAFVLDGTLHCVVLARRVHNDHLHLAHASA